MKKALFWTYVFISGVMIPLVIGSGVAEYLMRVYENFSHHWIAAAAICFFSGAVASWFPMLFLIDKFRLVEPPTTYALIGWVGGTVAPIFGFRNLGMILGILLILTVNLTLSSLPKFAP